VLVVLEVERADELLGAPPVPFQVDVAHRWLLSWPLRAGRSAATLPAAG
jgi:hypothetical protein